ncbi:MAG: hypothetical protein QOE65_497 [Solirubrobacteraceae bacterium]|nr:hypothetical protein [Solirubrobacteraceae bacterium]
MTRRSLDVLVLVLVLAGAFAASARAGTYVVRACGADGVNRAFAAGATGGMRAFTHCPATTEDGMGTGMVARADQNAGGGALGLHSSAWQVFEAPAGASLQSVSFNQSAGRGSGCWALGIWGWDGDAFHPGDFLWGFPGDCSQTPGGFARFMGPFTVDLRGHRKARFGVRCDSAGGCATNHPVATWLSLSDVAVTVRDDSQPAISPTGGDLLDEGWHRGTQSAWAYYSDDVGIRMVHGQIDHRQNFWVQDFNDPGWPDWARCDFARPRPCTDLNAGVVLDTATLTDGAHSLLLAAYDSAGNLTTSEHPLRVDNHAPLAPRGVAPDGGDGWRAANRFDVAWTNPPGQVSPIARAHWRLCRADGSDCRANVTPGAGRDRLEGFRVPGTGDWTLSVWVGDEAGNADEALAADPVHLRLDDVAPESPGFDLPDPADPRRVALAVEDRHSGLADVRIELRPRGGEWRALPTVLDTGGRASARIPDTELPDGPYDLRATLRDRAGNQRVVDADRAGRTMTVLLPLRTATRVRTGSAALRRCRRVGRRRVCRTTPAATPSATPAPLRAAFGEPTTVLGVLETVVGRPVGGVALEVSERLRGATSWRALGTTATDAAGAFRLALAPGPSRTLRLAYPGGDILLPAALEQRVLVPAAATLRASRRRVRNGARVAFSGRLAGRPLPPGGRTVDLQAHYRGAWRTFATPRTDARGRWRFPYRFGATRGRVVYRFRALVKRDAAYPYEQGASPTVSVTVTG